MEVDETTALHQSAEMARKIMASGRLAAADMYPAVLTPTADDMARLADLAHNPENATATYHHGRDNPQGSQLRLSPFTGMTVTTTTGQLLS